MARKQIIILCFMVLSTLVFSFTPAVGNMLVQNIRYWSAPDHTRIVIDTDSEPKFGVEKSEGKLIIDFPNAGIANTVSKRFVLNKTGIKKIFVAKHPNHVIRVTLLLTSQVETKIFRLKKFQEKPDRVVIDITFPDVEKADSLSREAVKTRRKDKIVVIDPGHGGDDPGAIGKNGTQEKTVVLAISKKLRDKINRKRGYRAFLTRKGDYYVSFKKRLTIAKEYGADLFISIHADAFWGRSARGSSVYCLSLRGASTEAGRLLASNENLSDIVGGVADTESSDESDPIVLNMYQTNTINSSKAFGIQVLKHLEVESHIKHAVVQEAPFRVLKLPSIPSLLIETAFISNPGEEQMLRSSRFQHKIAAAIAEAVYNFSPVSPSGKPPTVLTGPVRENTINTAAGDKSKVNFYKVRRGDTLYSIARKYDTTVEELIQINRIKVDSPLYVGKKLKLPPIDDKRLPKEEGRRSRPDKTKDNSLTYRIGEGVFLTGINHRHPQKAAVVGKVKDPLAYFPLYVERQTDVSGETASSEAKPDEKRLMIAVSFDEFAYRVSTEPLFGPLSGDVL